PSGNARVKCLCYCKNNRRHAKRPGTPVIACRTKVSEVHIVELPPQLPPDDAAKVSNEEVDRHANPEQGCHERDPSKYSVRRDFLPAGVILPVVNYQVHPIDTRDDCEDGQEKEEE